MTSRPAIPSEIEQFWKRQYEMAGNLPGMWFGTAYNLIVSADVLGRFEGNIREEQMAEGPGSRKYTKTEWERLSVFSVSAMLRAMAAECLLKALWVKHGNAFVTDGHFEAVLKKEHHRLRVIAERVAADAASKNIPCEFTERELQLLKFVSHWIMRGRYPIQTKLNLSSPIPSWTGDPIQELKALTTKLQSMLGLKMKFADDPIQTE